MKKVLLPVFVILTVSISVLDAASFPSTFTKCSKSDPNFDECLRNAIEVATRYIAKNGLPKLKIPSLDPLEVPEIILNTNGSVVQLKQKYNDVKFYGYSDIVIKKAQLDWDKKILKFTHYLPVVSQISSYDFNGTIVGLPIYGNGQINITTVNFTTFHTITFKEKTIDSKHYFEVVSYKVDWTIDEVLYQLENLYNGDNERSKSTVKKMHENWRAIFDDVNPELKALNAAVYGSFTQSIFSSIPLEDIFLK